MPLVVESSVAFSILTPHRLGVPVFRISSALRHRRRGLDSFRGERRSTLRLLDATPDARCWSGDRWPVLAPVGHRLGPIINVIACALPSGAGLAPCSRHAPAASPDRRRLPHLFRFSLTFSA
jgi:hypothetical protein